MEIIIRKFKKEDIKDAVLILLLHYPCEHFWCSKGV